MSALLVEQEATEAIKPILGKYYAKDTRNVWRALWQDWDACHYAAPDISRQRRLLVSPLIS